MNKFVYCWREASEYNRDAYISDMALSSIWEDEPEAPIPAARLEWLGKLWDIYHGGVSELISSAGLSQRALAERFCIPYRTVENWFSKSQSSHRECPPYVLSMMAELLIKQ